MIYSNFTFYLYEDIKNQLQSLLQNSAYSLVTTMIDLYACPSDMPKKSEINEVMNYIQKVEFLENAFKEDINNEKFLPYLQLHEFEGLLFSDVSAFLNSFEESEFDYAELQATAEAFQSPELINNSPETAPSKRLIAA